MRNHHPSTGGDSDHIDGKSASLYENFDIRISRRMSDGMYPISANSPYGNTEFDILQDFPFDNVDLQEALEYLEALVARPEDAEKVGEILWAFLFPPAIKELYEQSRFNSLAKGKWGLRIRLYFQSPELIKMPWEYCRDNNGFLALSKTSPLLRFNPYVSAPKPNILYETPRMLIALASPDDLPRIDIETTEKMLREILANLVTKDLLELKVITHATRRSLRREFRVFDPHILHIVGQFQETDDSGTLILENKLGVSQYIDAYDMWVLLQDSSIRLLYLDACESAIMGQKLVGLGVPAVIAMQYSIPDQTSIDFQRDFFEFLSNGLPVDAAMTEARMGGYFDHDDKYFWAIPTLMTNAVDGVIWHLKKPAKSKTLNENNSGELEENILPKQIINPDLEKEHLEPDQPILDKEEGDRDKKRRTILVRLLKNIKELFSEEELNTLCFHLGIDYDDLPAQGKTNKVRELIALLDRLDRVNELVEICKRERSNYSWDEL